MRTSRTITGLLLLLMTVGLIAGGKTSVKPDKRGSAPSAAAVKRLGAFTNMRFTREHQRGYSVELWREKDRVFGFLLVSNGLIGDTPTGLLEDVAFDPKTGKLTFRARLSTASTFDKNNEQVPTRDVYRFSGALRGQTLAGILEHTDASARPAATTKTNVSLRRSKSESESMTDVGSYDEWKKEANEILKLRGPKW